jgi:hypothetical protein
MNVHLTFDVEVWCGSWAELDRRFPAAFERYCYGRSESGAYALPKTVEILGRHDLQGVFFVEPLFAARFGERWLSVIVDLLLQAGQDVQLHLHTEWTDEISPPPIVHADRKRQHLTLYDLDEQTALIAYGRRLLERAKGSAVSAFRAGSFAANRDTYRALRSNGIGIDSSLNACYDYSGGTIDGLQDFASQRDVEGVRVYPVTVLRDGFGRHRAAQLNGCTFAELRAALLSAQRAGVRHFVIVSHNFEMLKPGTSEPDWTVVRRFEALCAFLAERSDLFTVVPLPAVAGAAAECEVRPSVGPWLTARRYAEQLGRMVR